MTEADMRQVLRQYGLTFNPFRQNGTTYVRGIANRKGRSSVCHLGKLAELTLLDGEMFESIVAMKSRALEGRVTKCAQALCMKRSYEGNRVEVQAAQGRFVIFLCDKCYEEYIQPDKGEPHENSQSGPNSNHRPGTNARCNASI